MSLKASMLLIAFTFATSCDQSPSNLNEYEANLKETLRDKPAGKSDAYALMKDTSVGPAWLATIHGYPSNLSVCEELIAPYNEDPELSVIGGSYYCEAI